VELEQDFVNISRDMLKLVERGVGALEKLASEPQVEIEAGPPICPECGVFDPEVEIQESASKGKLSEFCINAVCSECGTVIYGVIESYSMHASIESLNEEMAIRRAGANSGRTDS
jgi:hypothetical protein